MNRGLILGVLLTAMSVRGQGTIYFSTKVGNMVDAPISYERSRNLPPLIGQLFVVSVDGRLSPLLPTAIFSQSLDASGRLVMNYIDPVVVVAPNTASGKQLKLRLRVYTGTTYDATVGDQRAESNDFYVTLGTTETPGLLVGLTGFSIPTFAPEPRTGLLWCFGVALGLGWAGSKRRAGNRGHERKAVECTAIHNATEVRRASAFPGSGG